MNARAETSPPPGIEETIEGFLRFWLRIADPAAVYEYPERGETHTVSAEVLCAPEWLDALVGKPLTIGHPHGGSRFVTIDDAKSFAVGHVMETAVYGDEPYARVQADTPEAAAWIRARETSGFYCSPMYTATVEEIAPGEVKQTARLSANHLALTDSPRGGSKCKAILTLGDETLPGLRISLTPEAPDLTKAIEKIAEIVPGFNAAIVPEIDLIVGIPADKAEIAAAEIARAGDLRRSRKDGPPVANFYGVIPDPADAEGNRPICLTGWAGPYLYEAAERIFGRPPTSEEMPCPARLRVGSTAEPLTTAQIEAIGSLRFSGEDEIAVACARLSLLGGDEPVAVILADEDQTSPTKEGRVPLPEKSAAAVAALSEEMRAALDPVIAAIFEDVGEMVAAKLAEMKPVADMGGKEKMLADEVKTHRAEIAKRDTQIAQLLADAKSAKIAAARPAVLRLAKAQGIALADETSDADVIAAAEKIGAKVGAAVKGIAALDAVILADALAPAGRSHLTDPPKVETNPKPAISEKF